MRCNETGGLVQSLGMDTAPRAGRIAGLAAWLGLLAAVIVGFGAMGGGALAGPPLSRPGAWGAWLAGRDAPQAAFAVLRLVVLGLAWYLLAATVAATGARLLRAGRLVTVVDVLTLPAVRRLVHGAVGVGLATTVAAGVAAHATDSPRPSRADVALATAGHDGPAPATMQLLDDASVETIERLDDGADGPVETMERLDGAQGGHDGDEPARDRPDVWVAEAGDHLWSIAARTLEAAWDRPVSDDDVAPYWRDVVELNRPDLPDPGNPDLLHPGHEVRLPAPPAPPLPGR